MDTQLHSQCKIDITYNDEYKSFILEHGLHLCKKIKFSPCFDILQSIPFQLTPSSTIFTFLTNNCIAFYSGETHFDSYFSIDQHSISELVYVSFYEIYVALYGLNILKLFTSAFEEYFSTAFDKTICSLKCNDFSSNTPNILTCSPGTVCLWMFRLGGRKISSRLEHNHIISDDETPKCVHLEHYPGNLQKCFLSVSNSIVVFQLESGVVLSRMNNIHENIITSILYVR